MVAALIFFVLLIIVLVKFLKYLSYKRFIRSIFNDNLIVYGPKGSGKDLITQIAVYYNYKHDHNFLVKFFSKIFKKDFSSYFVSNMNYGYNTKVVSNLAQVFDIKNTFVNAITGEFNKVKKLEEFEGYTMLISDCGIYFPSHEDTLLKKLCSSFPMFYALSRHLYNMNIIINTQCIDRVWKSLREQIADGYLLALGSKKVFFGRYLKVSYRYYSSYQSAVNGLLPFADLAVTNKMLDGTVKTTVAGATKDQFEATNGIIKEGYVLIPVNKIKYNTRQFEDYIFESGEVYDS